jgi:transcriptional regulator with XRE-family HTH domain
MHRTPPDGKNTSKRTRPLYQDPVKLRRRRIASGKTLDIIAAEAGCSKGHLSDLETGNCGASAALLVVLAAVYGCEATDLMPSEPQESVA